ncbi:MAG: hypothetical protein R3Y50_06165 [Rikenellaceae bacterium]
MVTSSQTIDTVKVVETLRDTVVRVEADSSLIRALIECDSVGEARLKDLIEIESGRNLKPPSLQLENNILTAKVNIDSMDIYLTYKERYKEAQRVETITKTIEVNRLTRWQKWMTTLGTVALGAIVAFIAITIFKLLK